MPTLTQILAILQNTGFHDLDEKGQLEIVNAIIPLLEFKLDDKASLVLAKTIVNLVKNCDTSQKKASQNDLAAMLEKAVEKGTVFIPSGTDGPPMVVKDDSVKITTQNTETQTEDSTEGSTENLEDSTEGSTEDPGGQLEETMVSTENQEDSTEIPLHFYIYLNGTPKDDFLKYLENKNFEVRSCWWGEEATKLQITLAVNEQSKSFLRLIWSFVSNETKRKFVFFELKKEENQTLPVAVLDKEYVEENWKSAEEAGFYKPENN